MADSLGEANQRISELELENKEKDADIDWYKERHQPYVEAFVIFAPSVGFLLILYVLVLIGRIQGCLGNCCRKNQVTKQRDEEITANFDKNSVH